MMRYKVQNCIFPVPLPGDAIHGSPSGTREQTTQCSVLMILVLTLSWIVMCIHGPDILTEYLGIFEYNNYTSDYL